MTNCTPRQMNKFFPHLHLLLSFELLLLLRIGELDDQRRRTALHGLRLMQGLDGADRRLLAGEGDKSAPPRLTCRVAEDSALFDGAVSAEQLPDVVLAELLVQHADEEFAL